MVLYHQRSYRVYCRADPNYNLTASKGMAILAPADASDHRQHWYKDDKYRYKKDKWNFPSFSLINKATGQTLKHYFSHPFPVRLINYNPDVLDESVLWALAEDRGEGYRAIRSLACESHLEAAALNDSSFDGAVIMGGKWINGNNQQWKVEPYC